jgi:hypothetical protein
MSADGGLKQTATGPEQEAVVFTAQHAATAKVVEQLVQLALLGSRGWFQAPDNFLVPGPAPLGVKQEQQLLFPVQGTEGVGLRAMGPAALGLGMGLRPAAGAAFASRWATRTVISGHYSPSGFAYGD